MKKIVIDSNIVVALSVLLPYTPQARQQMTIWGRDDYSIFTPTLWAYEVTSALRKLIVAGVIGTDDAEQALKYILSLDIQQVPLNTDLYLKTLDWANQLGQGQTYDAAYLALAEKLGAEFWTADKRLVNRAKQIGVSWVYAVE